MGTTKNDIQEGGSMGLNEFIISVSAGEALRHGDMYVRLARKKMQSTEIVSDINEQAILHREVSEEETNKENKKVGTRSSSIS